MKSTDRNTNDAVADISAMTGDEEILAYIHGDNRKTVVDRAYAKMQSIRRAKEEAEAPPEETAGESLELSDADVNRAAENIWLYHKDQEPRKFEKGEVIPEGWELHNKWKWARNPKIGLKWAKP